MISVSSVATAREALLHGGIDVAVLDLRLENDEDADDVSGLALARELAQADSRAVPTIIMSGDPNPDTLLWASHERGTNRFLSVVRKDQGPDALRKEIAKAILRPNGCGKDE